MPGLFHFGDGRGPRSGLEGILVEVQPEIRECLRTIIGVRNEGCAGDLVQNGIQFDPQIVVGPILPVGRSGATVGRAVERVGLSKEQKRGKKEQKEKLCFHGSKLGFSG